jgi:hypothetical protein
LSRVPWQLQTKRQRRKGESRPLLESLPLLNVNVLAKRDMFPRNWVEIYEYDGYIAPQIAKVELSRKQVRVFHSGKIQTVPVYWRKQGFGLRPLFVCQCKRKAFKLRLIRQTFQCYRCCGVQYLSRSVSSAHRPILQKKRLEWFIRRWDGPMQWRTYHRISGLLKAYKARLPSKYRSRLIEDYMCKPLSAYSTCVAFHRA